MSMIKLTPHEANTYEGVKQGLTIKEIAKKSGIGVDAIRHHIRFLLSVSIIVRHGHHKHNYTYTAVDKPYIVEKKEPKPRSKVAVIAVDHLLDAALNIVLTEDQRFYLTHHKDRPRTVLARRTGLTRLQLNFALERLG